MGTCRFSFFEVTQGLNMYNTLIQILLTGAIVFAAFVFCFFVIVMFAILFERYFDDADTSYFKSFEESPEKYKKWSDYVLQKRLLDWESGGEASNREPRKLPRGLKNWKDKYRTENADILEAIDGSKKKTVSKLFYAFILPLVALTCVLLSGYVVSSSLNNYGIAIYTSKTNFNEDVDATIVRNLNELNTIASSKTDLNQMSIADLSDIASKTSALITELNDSLNDKTKAIESISVKHEQDQQKLEIATEKLNLLSSFTDSQLSTLNQIVFDESQKTNRLFFIFGIIGSVLAFEAFGILKKVINWVWLRHLRSIFFPTIRKRLDPDSNESIS